MPSKEGETGEIFELLEEKIREKRSLFFLLTI